MRTFFKLHHTVNHHLLHLTTIALKSCDSFVLCCVVLCVCVGKGRHGAEDSSSTVTGCTGDTEGGQHTV